jgi:ABC-type phosphate transport system auxiliary subunit
MTEKEVLEKLDFFKQAIQKLKEERDYWKEQAEENPQKVCETEGWIEAWKKLNEEHLEDAETIAELRTEVERADSAYAKLAHMYNEKNNSDKKYTEEDLKKLLHKASEKTKAALKAQEEEIDRLNTKCENLEITNRDLERELQEKNIKEDIDKVLEGEITEKEIDEILTKPTKVVKLDV